MLNSQLPIASPTREPRGPSDVVSEFGESFVLPGPCIAFYCLNPFARFDESIATLLSLFLH